MASIMKCPREGINRREFLTGSVECAPDDRFLPPTDGLLEVMNAQDEEFGLAGVKAVVASHAGSPLNEITPAVMDAARRHGRATDDQSLLLVRCHVRSG
jgi:serine phosphatase RsbU (regulator of sigma subunit)